MVNIGGTIARRARSPNGESASVPSWGVGGSNPAGRGGAPEGPSPGIC